MNNITSSTTTTTPETRITKDKRDGWEAETRIPLGMPATDEFNRDGERMLHLNTRKHINGGLYTRASVCLHRPDGCYTHAMGLGTGCGDYSIMVSTPDRTIRCTEKAVREQHARAIALAPQLIEQAKLFYAHQDARRAAEKAQQQAEQQRRAA